MLYGVLGIYVSMILEMNMSEVRGRKCTRQKWVNWAWSYYIQLHANCLNIKLLAETKLKNLSKVALEYYNDMYKKYQSVKFCVLLKIQNNKKSFT